MLRKYLGLSTYKLQLVQQLKPLDHRKRRDFGEWAEKKIALDPVLKIEILFSDEAHFCVSGYGDM